MRRLSLFVLLSALLLASLGCSGLPQSHAAAPAAAPPAASPRPNLLVVLSDDQRWDTLGVPGFTQEIFADDAVKFLHGQTAQTGPFLLWLGFTAPHAPYEPNPERIAALYAGRSDAELLPPGFPRDVKANDWRHYDEAVSHLDEQLGRVLATLEETGLARRTIVVLLGDNGYMMGERGVGGPDSGSDGKQVPYESSLRVPFVMAGPGLPRGLVSDLPVSSMDLPPTLLSLAGLHAPDAWLGRDLVAALAGRSPCARPSRSGPTRGARSSAGWPSASCAPRSTS